VQPVAEARAPLVLADVDDAVQLPTPGALGARRAGWPAPPRTPATPAQPRWPWNSRALWRVWRPLFLLGLPAKR